MNDLTIGPGTQVTLNFSVELEDGHIIDSNFDSEPVSFTVGDGSLLKGFEEAIFGLKSGDEGVYDISPEKGFGQHNPSNIQSVPRDQFPKGIELEEGLLLSFADAQSNELPGMVAEFDDETVSIDFNHPLAGRNICFRVRIVSVNPEIMH